MAITPLQEKASELAEENRFQAARPYLEEIVNRFREGTEEEQSSLGPVYFFIGLSYLQEFSQEGENALLQSAVDAFSLGLENGVSEEREIAILEFRGDAYRGLGNFEKAAEDYSKVASPPLSRRLRPEDEADVLEKLSLCLYALRDWDQALPWFLQFLEKAQTDQKKALAAGYLLEAYIEQDNVKGILELLPLITVDNPSRYSVSLNVALMQAGDKLADNGRYAQAALLYNATLTREQILRYFEEREAIQAQQIERMRAINRSEERMADEIIELENTRQQLEAVRQVTPYTSQLMARVARNYYLAGRDYEAVWAYLRFVENYPDDPIAQEFRFAAFITATKLGMDRLSRELGTQILEGDSPNEDFRKRVLLSLTNAYLESEDEMSFFKSAEDFLEEFPDSPEAAQVVFMLGNYLLNRGKMEELQDRFSILRKELGGTAAEDGLLYWPGLAYLFEGQFEESRKEMNELRENFPESVYREDASYRLAMSYYGSDDTEKAVDSFNGFIREFPNSGLLGEVNFFLGEIAASGGDLLDAIKFYEKVPELTDNISFITSAYFQKAKLLRENDAVNRAADTYLEYIERYGVEGQLTQAIYKLGEIKREQGLPGEALEQYKNAILEFGDDSQNLGVDPMIATYVEQYDEVKNRLTQSLAFLEKAEADPEFRKKIATNRGFLYKQFSDNPSLDPDLYEELRKSDEFSRSLAKSAEPILPLIARYQKQLDSIPPETPEIVFSREFSEAKRSNRRTLAMRLQMALEDLGAAPRSPLVIDERDIEIASPKLLVWIGENQVSVDPELAEKAYRKAINYGEIVDEQVDAYLNLGDMLLAEGRTEEAMELYAAAEENFPADPRVYRALFAQAEVLSIEGKPEQAREELLQILKTPEWRGEVHAEALYRVGLTYFEEGQYPQAHGFFERTFIGYGLFDEWAARSYLMDAKTLVEMNDLEGARRTLDEALEDDQYQNTEVYSELVEYANQI